MLNSSWEVPDNLVKNRGLEVLVSVLDGERARVLNAERASNIEVFMGLASDFNLGAIIVGGAEAWPLGRSFQPAAWPSEPGHWTV